MGAPQHRHPYRTRPRLAPLHTYPAEHGAYRRHGKKKYDQPCDLVNGSATLHSILLDDVRLLHRGWPAMMFLRCTAPTSEGLGMPGDRTPTNAISQPRPGGKSSRAVIAKVDLVHLKAETALDWYRQRLTESE